MKPVVLSLLSIAGLFAAGLFTSKANAAETYGVDVVHSNVLFKVKHNGFSYVYGRFNAFDADVRWDEADASNSSVSLTIDAQSVDTNNERRDQHLRSPDFFNARQHPDIVFRSTEINGSNGEYQVAGEVTLLGVTRPVGFTWTETGSGEGPRGDFRRGGIATFTVNRGDFGMNFMPDGLSDEIELIVTLQLVRQ